MGDKLFSIDVYKTYWLSVCNKPKEYYNALLIEGEYDQLRKNWKDAHLFDSIFVKKQDLDMVACVLLELYL